MSVTVPVPLLATAFRHGNTDAPELARALPDREPTLTLADQTLRARLNYQGVAWQPPRPRRPRRAFAR